MRLLFPFSGALALLLSTISLAQRMAPAPEPRQDIPTDKCLIELTLPSRTKVSVDDRDYGEQRKIMLAVPTSPTPKPPLAPNELPGPWLRLSADFSNGGRLSEYIEAKGGTVVRVALSAPPVESVLLEGPSGQITSVAVSPDGKCVVMGTESPQAILWEASTGWIRWNGDVPRTNVSEDSTSVAFSPDGRQVLVAMASGGVALVDAATGNRVRDFYCDSSEDESPGASAVAFSPDGRLIAAALSWQEEPLAVVCDANSGKHLRTLRGPKPPADGYAHQFDAIAFSPNGRYIVAGSSLEMAILFDAANGKILRTYPSKSGAVLSVAVSRDGDKLLMGTSETAAVLWGLNAGKQLRVFHCAADEGDHEVSTVGFSPDGRLALAGCGDGTFLFDVDSGTTVRTFNSSDAYDAVATFSPDGRRVFTAGSRGRRSRPEAVLWEAASGKQVQAFRGPRDTVRSLAFSANGDRLTVGYNQGRAVVWDVRTGKPVEESRQAKATEDEGIYKRVPREYTSADGRWTVSSDGAVVLTDSRTSKETTILRYASYEPIRVAFSAKTPRIAVADEGSVQLFDPETGKELATLISAYGGRVWLVMTPGNYFESSPGGRSLIRWRVGEAEYPFGRFEKQFRRPDLVAKILQD